MLDLCSLSHTHTYAGACAKVRVHATLHVYAVYAGVSMPTRNLNHVLGASAMYYMHEMLD